MRNGILAAGNWVFDNTKFIDTLPEKGMLASILDEDMGGGGAPYNVLIDLAKMKVNFPLYGAGLIGNDHKGTFLLDDLKKFGIDHANMHTSTRDSTSYTDVMTEKGSGDRTFFHYRGTNSLLDYDILNDIDTNAKIFHLGYLLLLDKLDKEDPKYGVVSAKALKMLQEKGYKTSVDVVSESGDRFKRLVTPALKYIDYLIINEIEAERTSGYKIREGENINRENLRKAVDYMMENGVNERVVIHFPEGGYAVNKNGDHIFVPSFLVKPKEIVSANGAGDAFCAGILYAIHENLPLEESIKLANASARFNLTSSTTTGGAVTLKKIQDYINNAELRKPVI